MIDRSLTVTDLISAKEPGRGGALHFIKSIRNDT